MSSSQPRDQLVDRVVPQIDALEPPLVQKHKPRVSDGLTKNTLRRVRVYRQLCPIHLHPIARRVFGSETIRLVVDQLDAVRVFDHAVDDAARQHAVRYPTSAW